MLADLRHACRSLLKSHGFTAAAGAARLIRTLLFSVEPLDPLIYGGVALLLVFIAALACLLPSLRATRIDPIIAFQTESGNLAP